MSELLYGVWKGVPFDNRMKPEKAFPEGLSREEFDAFSEGNPVSVFLAPQGFLVFDGREPLLDALLRYYRRVETLSCGRCTPCRAGSRLIVEALEKAAAGEGCRVDWNEILTIAEQMKLTSLCGIGLTSAEPLIGALRYFRNEVAATQPLSAPTRGFYAEATAPCIEACPAHVNVPRYIDYVRDGHPELAVGVLLEHYPLIGACGRVCVRPCERFCARHLVDRAVAIRDIKRYAADSLGADMSAIFDSRAPESVAARRRRGEVAVIGAGPAGISCAYHLLLAGHSVDIYEQRHHAGGMARYGIPEYRLPNKLLEDECSVVGKLGGRFHFGQKFGRDFSINSLFAQGFRAVFIGTGCPEGRYLGLPDEDTSIPEYVKGLDFLMDVARRQNRGEEFSLDGDVVVVGCGNVAMDCCRTARRLMRGKNFRVTVAYRRTRESATADPGEMLAAEEEGIDFQFLVAPERILVDNGRITGLLCSEMKQGEPDETGRRSVSRVEGSEFVIPCRYVISAIGQVIDRSVFKPEDNVWFTSRGIIEIDRHFRTTRPGVFAGGDAATGPKTLILSMAQGEKAASSIHQHLMTGEAFFPRERLSEMIAHCGLLGDCTPPKAMVHIHRKTPTELSSEVRRTSWLEVEKRFTDEEAWAEVKRCMRCYRLFAAVTEKPVPGVNPAAPQ
ncbi:MAG: NADH-4Fe-4S domain-containing protein [Burkholderia sp.]|jgi:formate dehydrogenase (NADP+) beta subunit